MLLSACATAPQVDLTAEEEAVRAVSARWLQLEGAKDAAAIASLFTEDGAIYRENEEPMVGPAAIQAHMAKEYAAAPQASSSWSTDRVDIATSGDLAVERGAWTATGTPDGDDHGWFVTLYRKVGEEWKVVADMSVSTKAEAAAADTAKPAN
jgi:uncharacterized protein (TIGR02246 family)